METPWKVIVAFVGVFAAGAIFGGVFTLRASNKRFAEPAPRPIDQPVTKVQPPQGPPRVAVNPITPALMRTFTRRFNFTPEQKEGVAKILGRAGEDLSRLRQQNYADVSRVNERMYADMSALMSPEQRADLEKMRREWHEKIEAGRQRKSEGAGAEEGGRDRQKEKGGARPTGN